MAAELVGLSFSVEPNVGYYIPVGHHSPDPQLSIQRVSEVLNPILANPSIRKVGHNIKYDLIVLKRIETGVVKIGDEVQILGLGEDKKSVVTGVEMFRKLLDEGEAGDNVGLLLRGIDKNEIKRGMILCHPATQIGRAYQIGRASCRERV